MATFCLGFFIGCSFWGYLTKFVRNRNLQHNMGQCMDVLICMVLIVRVLCMEGLFVMEVCHVCIGCVLVEA